MDKCNRGSGGRRSHDGLPIKLLIHLLAAGLATSTLYGSPSSAAFVRQPRLPPRALFLTTKATATTNDDDDDYDYDGRRGELSFDLSAKTSEFDERLGFSSCTFFEEDENEEEG